MPASLPAEDLDLRLVRYFTVVADHLHFGRAADALHLAQPSLSRQIRRLEDQLDARLLERGPRGTRLTEAGQAFLPRARALLRAAAQAAALARSAARPARIAVGFTSGTIITPAVRQLRRRHPEAEVHPFHLAWHDVRAALLDHRADAVVTHLPLRGDQLDVTVLYAEPRVLLVSADHRLAGRQWATLDDIADEPVPRVRKADPDWSAFWHIDPRPDGRPAPGGPLVDDLDDKFELIASGQCVAIAPPQRGMGLRPDITTVPLRDVGPCHVALATRAGEDGALLSSFRAYARAHLAGGTAAPPPRPDPARPVEPARP